jgi:hypothetical protein
MTGEHGNRHPKLSLVPFQIASAASIRTHLFSSGSRAIIALDEGMKTFMYRTCE